MTAGNLMVYFSLILAIVGIVLSFLRLKTKSQTYSVLAALMAFALFAVVTLSVIYLYILFITSDMSVNYVWEYSSTSLPLVYKVSGVLAGKAGSLLFWIWMAILPWTIEELWARKKGTDNDILHWTRLFVMVTMAVLLIVLIQHDVFGLTSPDALTFAPNGNGLSPLLQTELMVIHPPVVFIAYGVLVIPFAAGLAHLMTGQKDWVKMALMWGRIGWLFLTLGIGIGGLWAYVVLGWGGYWAWDPVETSSLLPWILLTGALHAQLMYKRKGDYQYLAPVTGIMTFLLVIFATFATRAGGLWVSVHTFGQADTSIPVMERLADILVNNPTLAIYLGFIFAILIMTVVLVFLRRRSASKDKTEKYYTLSELISDNILMTVAIYMMIVTTAVTLMILMKGVNGLGPDEFNAQVGVLTFIGVLVLIICLIWRDLGRRSILLLTLGVLIASAIGFFLFPEQRAFASSAPLLIVALGSTVFKVVKSVKVKRLWSSMRLVSAHLIHLAVALLLIGYVSSTFMVSENDVSTSFMGGSVDVEGYHMDIVNMDSTNVSIFLDIDVYKGNTSYIGRIRPGVQVIDGQLRNEITVADTLLEDIYVIYDYDQVDFIQGTVDLHVKILPMMKALWGGMWLMAIGIVLRLLTEAKLGKEKEQVEPEEDYEAKLDRELKDLDEEKGEVISKEDYEARLERELNAPEAE